MSANGGLVEATFRSLSALGVRQYLVCAGARNAPLMVPLLEEDVLIRNHFDERTAAFCALGIAKSTEEPVAVLTTSGTAVAQLLAATIEAYYSGVPLVLLTADRPKRYRGSGAPQAIEQADLLSPYALTFDIETAADFEALSEWDGTRPLQLNICLEEPRAGEMVKDFQLTWPPREPVGASVEGDEIDAFFKGADRLVVLLGEIPLGWRGRVERFLDGLGVPIYAEATSGLRESPELSESIVETEAILESLDATDVLRIGGVPSIRYWRNLEERLAVRVFSISPTGLSGLARDSGSVRTQAFPELEDVTQQGWVDDQTLLHQLPPFADHPFSEPAMMRALSRRIPSDDLIFLGNSLPIREWNLAADREVPHPRCQASRGANGIDGQIATFLGMASEEAAAWGIFGDLTALYDLNAPALLDDMIEGNRRIVIFNNGGGRIFSRLPSMASLDPWKKSIVENQHTRSFGSWAEMWDMEYVEWPAGTIFPDIPDGPVVIEVLLDNSATEAFWEACQ